MLLLVNNVGYRPNSSKNICIVILIKLQYDGLCNPVPSKKKYVIHVTNVSLALVIFKIFLELRKILTMTFS